MKKILILNNENDVSEYLKTSHFYDKIIALNYKVAIHCSQNNIKFIYIKEILKNNKSNLSKLLKDSFLISKKIDKKITKSSKILANNNYFSNYQKFSVGLLYIQIYSNYLNFLVNKFKEYNFFYYECNTEDYFNFLVKGIKVYKRKYLNKFQKILYKKRFNESNYFITDDDPSINNFKKLFLELSNMSLNKKLCFLIYLLNKEYQKKVQIFAKKNDINLFFYKESLLSKNYIKNINIEKIFNSKIIKNETKDLFLKEYLKYMMPKIINTVIYTKKNIENITKKNSFLLFLSSHNTLVSNTIRETFNKKNIKTLTTLHGGTVGHFKKGFFWPDLAHNNLPKAELSFYQTYSDTQKKILIKKNYFFNTNHNSQYLTFESENFNKLTKNIPSKKKSFLNIGYIAQSNDNIVSNFNEGINDPLNLYKFRSNFLTKIINKKNCNLLVSFNEKNLSFFADKVLIKKAKNLNKLKMYKMQALSVLKQTDFLILEQPSTTLIESLYLKVPTIIVINNPLWDFEKKQKKLLNKRILFVKSYNDIFKLFNKNISIPAKDNIFLNQFYTKEKKKNFDYFLNKLVIT